MSNQFRVVLDDKLLPAQIFFNSIPDRAFVDTLKAFKSGSGAGFNDAFCGFPGEEEFDEAPLNGIEFAVKGEEIVVKYDDFFAILEKACASYTKKNPDSIDLISNLLCDIKYILSTFSD